MTTQIELYQLGIHIARLRIETKTGMSSRMSTLGSAQRLYGVTSRTKKGALKELEQLYKEATGKEYGEPAKTQ